MAVLRVSGRRICLLKQPTRVLAPNEEYENEIGELGGGCGAKMRVRRGVFCWCWPVAFVRKGALKAVRRARIALKRRRQRLLEPLLRRIWRDTGYRA